jgi:hypothetical protein
VRLEPDVALREPVTPPRAKSRPDRGEWRTLLDRLDRLSAGDGEP